MKAQYTIIFFLALVLILIVAALGPVGLLVQIPALAQQAGVGESPTRERSAPSVDITPTMSYQGKLVENGSPVTGSRSMTFRLYDAASGGILYWSEGPKTVSVSSGLFTVTLGDTTPFSVSDFARKLYLEIQVASTVLPRQILQGTPYAFSLAPGAYVIGGTGDSLLYASNAGSGEGLKGYSISGDGVSGSSFTGHGVSAEGDGSALYGSALYARSTDPGGVALWAHNDSESSTDTTLALSNDGTGDLLKAFGGDGGNDEFNFKNDGTFQDKAPSYVNVPVTGATNWGTAATIYGDNGSCIFIDPENTGDLYIDVGVNLPLVLYGQPVQLEEIRVYYLTQYKDNYITETFFGKLIDNGYGSVGKSILLTDTSDHVSTTFSSYDVAADLTLSSDSGPLWLGFHLFINDVIYNLEICGVRIKLRHHPLY
jgi:hypothetical protein